MNLKEATTFPLIVYSMTLHETHIQMAFCPETPKWESRNAKVRIPATLGPYNFACKRPIEMRLEIKIVVLVQSFRTVCHKPPAHNEIGLIPDF